jgi:hypothetical protein
VVRLQLKSKNLIQVFKEHVLHLQSALSVNERSTSGSATSKRKTVRGKSRNIIISVYSFCKKLESDEYVKVISLSQFDISGM